MIWKVGISSFRLILAAFGRSKRRVLDISALKPIPPDDLQPNIAALENLGFRRLGEIYTKLPTFSSLGRSWIFISSDGLTLAEITEAWFKMVGFSTTYSDNATLETTFPMGERINTPNFRSHTITSDIEKAYQHHTQQITDFGKTHPSPRIIKSVEGYIEWDGIYRKLHITRKFLRFDLSQLTQFISLIYSIAVTLAILIYHTRSNTLTINGLHSPLITLYLAIVPAFLITYISVRALVSIGQRESKST